MRLATRATFAVLLGLFVFAGESRAPDVPPTADLPPGVDLHSLFERVHFSFRERGGLYVAGHGNHEIRVEDEGFVFRPGSSEGVAFEAARVRRGAVAFAREDAARIEREDGSLVLQQDGWAEHFANRAGGVEQSWSFAAEPEGEGDLVVELPLRDGRFLGADEAGLRFSAEDGVTMRYGHGTWIDAEGRPTAVESRWKDGAIALVVPESVLRDSRYPAILDPILSAELELKTPPFDRSSGRRDAVSIAENAGTFLVVWADRFDDDADLRAIRVDSSGNLMGAPIEIAAGQAPIATSSVVFDGSHFLVVWAAGEPSTVYAARIATDGGLLDPGGVELENGLSHPAPKVAMLGENALVVWADDGEIEGSLLEPATLQRTPLGRIGTTSGDLRFDVAALESVALVAWPEPNAAGPVEIRCARVLADGSLPDPVGFKITDSGGFRADVSVAAGGGRFLVGWRRSETNQPPARWVELARVSADGEVLDPMGLMAPVGDEIAQGAPALAWSGAHFRIAFAAEADTLPLPLHTHVGARLDADGHWIDATPRPLAAPSFEELPRPVLHEKGLLTFTAQGQRLLHATRLDADGLPLDVPPIELADRHARRIEPKVAAGDDGYLVVWHALQREEGRDVWELFASRIGVDGEVLDPLGIPMSEGPGDRHGEFDVAFGNGHYLVVWARRPTGASTSRLHLRALRPDGMRSPQATLEFLPDVRQPAVASDGTHFAVAWNGAGQIFMARFAFTGEQIGWTDMASAPGDPAQHPSVTWNPGGQYVVAWEQDFGIHVAIRSEELDGGASLRLTDSSGVHRRPALACAAAGQCVAVWEREAAAQRELVASRFQPMLLDGSPLVPTALTTLGGDDGRPEAVWDGSEFRVVWLEQGDVRTGLIPVDIPEEEPFDVEATTLQAGPAAAFALASRADGDVLLAWSTGQEDGVRARLLSEDPLPLLAASAAHTLLEDETIELTLQAHNASGAELTFRLHALPIYGTLSGTPPQLSYTPAKDFFGIDAFTFSVDDGSVESPIAPVLLAVVGVDDPPVALDGEADVTIAPHPFVLAASDPDGDPLEFVITRLPEDGTISGTPPLLVYTPPNHDGEYTLEYYVRSRAPGQPPQASAPATFTFRVVGNRPPEVRIEASTLEPTIGEAVRLEAIASDPEGDPLTYHWELGEGATSRAASIDWAFHELGQNRVTLRVTDGTNEVETHLDLEVVRAPLVVDVVDLPAKAAEAQLLDFVATASGGQGLRFEWSFGDGSQPEIGAHATHRYADDGEYEILLRLTDDAGRTVEERRTLLVENLPPTAEKVEPQTTGVGEELSLELLGEDPAGEADPLSWRLIEGPGTLSPEGLYRWTPEESGSFEVEVLLADDDGGETTLVFQVEVEAPPPGKAKKKAEGGCSAAGSGLSLLALLLVPSIRIRSGRDDAAGRARSRTCKAVQ